MEGFSCWSFWSSGDLGDLFGRFLTEIGLGEGRRVPRVNFGGSWGWGLGLGAVSFLAL